MARVATGPFTETFQCLYFAGSVRNSTMILVGSSAMLADSPLALRLAQNHPEFLGAPGSKVLPAMRCPAVEIGAVPRPELMALAMVMEGDLAFENVKKLHLAGIDDDLVRLDALGARAERRDDRPDLALEEPGPEHVPLLRGAVEGDDGVLALAADVEPSVPSRLEERRDGHPEGGGQLAEGGQGRREPARLDLGHHARRHARFLGELALLEPALRAQRLDPSAQRSHRPASPFSARATNTRVIFFRYGCVRSVLSSGLEGREAASATRAMSSGLSRCPTRRSAAASGAGRGWEATAPRVIAAS